MKKKRLLIILPLVLVALAVGCLLRIKHFAAEPLILKQETIFTLPAGTGRDGLQQLLRRQHLARHLGWLPWLMELEPSLAPVKAGTYRLKPGMTVRDLLQLLVSGKEAQFSIRFIEGSTLKEWLGILGRAPYMKHDLQGATAPTPIAMPGQASLEAAAHPVKSAYLYFVADGRGGHVFTTNLASHNQAVQHYRQRQNAKENHEQ